MRILFITAEPPWPPRGGASLRAYNLIERLAGRHRVSLACLATIHQATELQAHWGSRLAGIATAPPPERRTLAARAVGTVTSQAPDLARRCYQPLLGATVQQLTPAGGFELVHFVGLEAAGAYMGEAWQRPPGRVVVLDELNAEYLLQRRAASVARTSARDWAGAAYSWAQAHKLRRYERRACESAELVLAVSDDDAAVLHELAPAARIATVPNGVDTRRYCPAFPAAAVNLDAQAGDSARLRSPSLPREGLAEGEARPLASPPTRQAPAIEGASAPPSAPIAGGAPTVLFTGTMDFRPNVDAVRWFVTQVWPAVRAVRPDARFVIAGRNPTSTVRALAGEGVEVTGAVEDDLPYLQSASLFVVPMRFGGGSRLKLLQALACGLPIVATPAGAEGVRVTPGDQLLVAEDAQDFARGVVVLLQDRALAARLGEAGRALAARYDWDVVTQQLEQAYQSAFAAAG